MTGWRTADGGVAVHLDDSTEVAADVLVIADGAGSALAEHLAGRPTSAPSGLIGVAGVSRWANLSASTRALLSSEPMLAVGPGGTGLFATMHDPGGSAAVSSDAPSLAVTREPTAIWGLLAVEDLLGDRRSLVGAELARRAVQLLERRHWSPALTGLVAQSDATTVSSFRLQAADPAAIAPWQAGRVTALGDAVHAMPPTGGQGAAVSILDAHSLARHLLSAQRGERTVAVAVHDYEAEMRVRGARAVRESLQPLGWIRGAATPAGSLALRGLTPLAAGAAAMVAAVRARR